MTHHSSTATSSRHSRPYVYGRLFVIGARGRSGLRPPIPIDLTRLPRYMRAKALKTGTTAYYWAIPTWAKRQGCELQPKPLGPDRTLAIMEAERLNSAFDVWRRSRTPRPIWSIPTRKQRAARAVLREFSALAGLNAGSGDQAGSPPVIVERGLGTCL